MNTFPASPQIETRETGGLWGGISHRLRQIEGWLDQRGRGAWIATMVLGFVFFWPLGLFLTLYITATNRWSKDMFGSCTSRRRTREMGRSWQAASRVARPSGNTAFDAYKAETLRRLEDEQEAFEAFLDRLRAAKDKSEFDAFMEDRAKGAKGTEPTERSGEY